MSGSLSQTALRVAGVFAGQQVVSVTSLGAGNINDTFLVEKAEGRFVLQRINREVFPSPALLVENYSTIAKYLAGSSDFQLPSLLKTSSETYFHIDEEGEIWRATEYLNSTVQLSVASELQAHSMGRTLSFFHSLAQQISLSEIADPLPGFHNLPAYLTSFDSLYGDSSLLRRDARCELVIQELRSQADLLEEGKRAGKLPQQVIHGDPKCDNFIFDERSQAIGMFDFDTAAVGLLQYDLGDCLRSCCNPAGELAGVPAFDLDLCKAILKGYGESVSVPEFVFESVLLLSFELGLRFYTDHLMGNKYFRVAKDGLNLHRARRQFILLDDIRKKETQIRQIIDELTY